MPHRAVEDHLRASPMAWTFVRAAMLGRPIRYRDPGPLAYWRRMRARGMPAGMVAVTLGIYTTARLGLAAGLTDDVRALTGRAPLDFRAFARDHAAAWGPIRGRTATP